MLSILIEGTIKIVSYSMFIFSIYLLFGKVLLLQPLQTIFESYRTRKRSKLLREKAKESIHFKKRWFLINHLNFLLKSVFPKYDGILQTFIFLVLTIFTVTFVFFVVFIEDILISLALAILIGGIPYYFLWLRLLTIRNRSAYALLDEFNILFQNYQVSRYDMYYAIKLSIEQFENAHLKNTFLRLAHTMSLNHSKADIMEATKIFAFTINTSFAKQLAKLILVSYIEQKNVQDSFLSLNQKIDNFKMKLEEKRSSRLDTIGKGYFSLFSPFLALGIAYASSGVLDFWYFFFQKDIFTFFIICCVVGLISFLLAVALRKPKADI